MEGLCKFYQDRGPTFIDLAYIEDDSDVEISISEILLSDNSRIEKIKTLEFNVAELSSWATNQNSTPDKAPAIRIAWIPTSAISWKCEVSKSTLNLLVEHFRVRTAFDRGLTASSLIAKFPGEGGRDEATSTYSIYLHDVGVIVWSHNHVANITQGICIGDRSWIEDMQSLFEYQSDLLGHFMMMAYFAAISLGMRIEKNTHRALLVINAVERRTGYHGWAESDDDVAEGDYSTLSAQMTGCAIFLADSKRSAKYLNEILSFAEDQLGLSTNDPRYLKLTQASDDCRKNLRRRLVVQEIDTEFWLQRTQNQLTAIYNLITQRDASLNIALAKDSRTLASASKRDSSSMKTLAAVTVAFLPATFVASFFAMPLFNWDADQNSAVVNGRFWIYWAVTVPLTLTTLVIWLSWTYRQTILHRAQDRKDRDQLVYDISGQENLDEKEE